MMNSQLAPFFDFTYIKPYIKQSTLKFNCDYKPCYNHYSNPISSTNEIHDLIVNESYKGYKGRPDFRNVPLFFPTTTNTKI